MTVNLHRNLQGRAAGVHALCDSRVIHLDPRGFYSAELWADSSLAEERLRSSGLRYFKLLCRATTNLSFRPLSHFLIQVCGRQCFLAGCAMQYAMTQRAMRQKR